MRWLLIEMRRSFVFWRSSLRVQSWLRTIRNRTPQNTETFRDPRIRGLEIPAFSLDSDASHSRRLFAIVVP